MATEAGFQIDGKVYEMPSRDTFTMDEWQVMYDLAGLGMPDFTPLLDPTDAEIEERVRQFKNPAVMRALMTIAYLRGNPDEPRRKVDQLIARANAYDALETLGDDEEASDEGPLDMTNNPEPSSVNDSSESKPSTSTSSERLSESSSPDLGRLAAVPAPTTASRSDTSSTSPPTPSAA